MGAARAEDVAAYAGLLDALPMAAAKEVHVAMGEPHRRYHAVWHLGRMWRLANEYAQADQLHRLAWMIAYHDIVYDVRVSPPANEMASANRFMVASARIATGLLHEEVEACRDAILASADHLHSRNALDGTGRLFLDLDLEPLASSLYDENTALLRAEFSHLDDDAWEVGRRRFVQAMLDTAEAGTSVYGSGLVPAAWEDEAVANMRRSLALSGPRP